LAVLKLDYPESEKPSKFFLSIFFLGDDKNTTPYTTIEKSANKDESDLAGVNSWKSIRGRRT